MGTNLRFTEILCLQCVSYVCFVIVYIIGITECSHDVLSIIYTYSMKQPDLYYFETIRMTSQA